MMLLIILSLIATNLTVTDLKDAAADQTRKQLFMLAEAGLEEARGRFQTTSPNRIIDSSPTNANWAVFIGEVSKVQGLGYDPDNSNYTRYDKITNLNYAVSIRHKLNSSGQILYWGDYNHDGLPQENTSTGTNIYVLTSQGFALNGGSKSLRMEVTSFPPVYVPAQLYAKDSITINGSFTKIHGIDACGGASVPGVMTQQTLTQKGDVDITGNPPIVDGSGINFNILQIIQNLKRYANIIVPPGQYTSINWGNPIDNGTDQPLSCSDLNVVYVDGNLILTGQQCGGCGILLVNGDFTVNGGFKWYGSIIVSGEISFTGGGQRNVTGAILSGGQLVTMDDSYGGSSDALYCSKAITSQTQDRPFLTLRWMELF
jgi:hypothetical protein